jgi:hypothetical protein
LLLFVQKNIADSPCISLQSFPHCLNLHRKFRPYNDLYLRKVSNEESNDQAVSQNNRSIY